MPQERKDENYSPAALSGVVVFIVVLMALGGVLLLVIGQPPTWNAAGFTMLALWLVVLVVGTVWLRKAASRYNCPQCGARLPRLHAEGSDTSEHRFLCRHCDTLWFTGVRDTDS